MLAPKFNLENLVLVVDRNGAQNDGFVSDVLSLDLGETLTKKIESFGWCVKEVDGNHYDNFESIIKNTENKRPLCIIANTVKGKGVSFMETPAWHAKAPNKEEYELAIKELS